MDFNKKKSDSDNLLSTIDENNYRQLIEYLSPFNLGIVLVDIKTKIPVVFNSAAHQILGYSGAEFKTKNIENHEAADDIALTNHLSESVDSGVVKQFETTLVSKSGEPRNFRMSLQKVKFGDHQYYLLMYEDITDEYSTTRLNQAERQVFTICNSVSSKTDFIRDLLSFFKSFSGCEAVGIRLRNGDDFPYFETTGFSKEFVEMEISLCAYDEGGNLLRESGGDPVLECMCGNVIRGRYDATKPFFTAHGSFWTGNTTQLLASTTEIDRQSRICKRCNGSGYESVALIPIRHNETTYGLIQFNDKRIGWHTLKKIEVLEYLIDYVSIALAKLQAEDARMESDQNFKQIINSTTEAILIQDAETGKILDVNDTMVRMFGFVSKTEALSKSISDISYGDYKTNSTRAIELVRKAASEGPQTFEWLCQKDNGKTFWAEIVLNRTILSGRKRILAVVRDISDRKRMEEALNSSKERYRLLFEEMIEGFALHEIILDQKGTPIDYRFLDVNPAFETLTGLQRDKLIGHTVKEVMPGIEDYWIEKYGQVALKGGDLRYENYAGDLEKWFKVTVYSPKFGQFVTVFEDITNKKIGDMALYESEEQFRNTFEQSSVGMCIVSLDGIFLRINNSFCQMVGYLPEELLGQSISLVTYPDDQTMSNQFLKLPITSGSPSVEFEKRYIHKSGQIIYVNINSTLIRDASGNPRHFITQVQDITENKKMVEALQLRDKIFIHSMDMLFIAGFDGYFKVLNPAFERTLGWTLEELYAKPWLDFVYPEDRKRTEEIKAIRLDSGLEIIQFENRYLCKDGSYKWLSWNSFPYPEEDIIVGVARDITERKALDESLHLSEERYKLINEASSDSIYSYDRQGRFTHVNSALCKSLGLTSDQIIGKTHSELGFPKEQCEEWEKLHAKVYETQKTVISETVATIKGEEKFYEVVLDPIYDLSGNIIGIAGTTRDIDARKKAEIKVREQMDELRRWNAVTLGRENRVIELKKEVNQLLAQLNLPPRYLTGNDIEEKL